MSKNKDLEIESTPVVLIVDDNSTNLQVLGTILKVKNWKIGVAVNGRLALQMVDAIKPDLILLDIMMPDISGHEVCRRLKATPSTMDIPIIFLTAKSDTRDIAEGFKLGAVDYVTKPFNSLELLARVTTQLELRRARDAKLKVETERNEAIAQMKELLSLLPICKNCKKKHDDQQYWDKVEVYIEKYKRLLDSSCLCEECRGSGLVS